MIKQMGQNINSESRFKKITGDFLVIFLQHKNKFKIIKFKIISKV